MKKLTVFITLILLSTVCFADQIIVPFDVYPKELQKVFIDNGINLDLDPVNRTRESWGFIKNEGTSFSIYSYKMMTPEEMEIIRLILIDQMGKSMSPDYNNQDIGEKDG